MVVSLIPAVLFPRALNIFSSAFVGSYLVIFAVGMFVFTSLSEIMLRVIKCVTISGYLTTNSNYPFELNGTYRTSFTVCYSLKRVVFFCSHILNNKDFSKKELSLLFSNKMNSRLKEANVPVVLLLK